jgi:chondroitin AC lyase
MKFAKVLLALLIFYSVFYVNGKDTRHEVNSLEIIRQNFLALYRNKYSIDEIDKKIKAYLPKCNPDGSCKGIDYNNHKSNKVQLIAMGNMAMALTDPRSAFCQDAALKEKLLQQLFFWAKRKPSSGTNWWSKEISVPMLLAKAILPLKPWLEKNRPKLLKKIAYMIVPCERRLKRHEGTNLADVGINTIALGVLLNDSKRVKKVFNEFDHRLFSPLSLPGKMNGHLIDGSYAYHNSKDGKLQLHGSYAIAFLHTVSKIFVILEKSDFRISESSEKHLVNYILDGFQWYVFNKMLDPHTAGRSMYRKGRFKISFTPFFRLANLLEYRKKELKAFAERLKKSSSPENFLAGNKMFWNTDFMVNRGFNYYTSVRMSSKRTIRSEGNNQFFSADGVNLLFRSGNEYDNVFVSWDLFAIPGTTEEYFTDKEGSFIPQEKLKELEKSINKIKNNVYARIDLYKACRKKYVKVDTGPHYGGTLSTGGVSDGLYGACGFDFHRVNVKAKKAWFFFKNRCMVLGAGIDGSSASKMVRTQVEQCRPGKNIFVAEKSGKLNNFKGAFLIDNKEIKWINNNNIGYIFPGSANVKVKRKIQTFSLNRVSETYLHSYDFKFNLKNASKDMFNIYFDHGFKPQNSQYAYMTVIGVTPQQTAELADRNPLNILKNTNVLQAVEDTENKVIEILAYKPGSVKGKNFNVEFQSDCPIAIVCRISNNKLKVAVAELQRKGGEKVKLKIAIKKDKNILTRYNFTITTPDKKHVGDSIIKVVNLWNNKTLKKKVFNGKFK